MYRHMRATNERLTILSEIVQAALYEIPDFDDAQRLNYLNLAPEEQRLKFKTISSLLCKNIFLINTISFSVFFG